MTERDISQPPHRFLPDHLPSAHTNDDEPIYDPGRQEHAFKWAKRTLGYGGAIVILGAFGFGLYNAIRGDGPFDVDGQKRNERRPAVAPLLLESPTSSPSPSFSELSPSPSASKRTSPSASASASRSASASASPTPRLSSSASASPEAQLSSPAETPITAVPTSPEPCAVGSGNRLVLCDDNVASGNFVGYRTLRDTTPLWHLKRNAQVTPECQVPGYVLVDDETRPVGSQAAYVPAAAVSGAMYNIPSCD